MRVIIEEKREVKRGICPRCHNPDNKFSIVSGMRRCVHCGYFLSPKEYRKLMEGVRSNGSKASRSRGKKRERIRV